MRRSRQQLGSKALAGEQTLCSADACAEGATSLEVCQVMAARFATGVENSPGEP